MNTTFNNVDTYIVVDGYPASHETVDESPRETIPRKRLGLVKKALWTFFGLVIVIPIVGSLIGVKVFQFRTMEQVKASFVPPPQPVNATEVRGEAWQPRLSAVGSVIAIQGIVVRTETEGIVKKIKFEPGANVQVGDELVVLDAEVELAELRAAEATAELARVTYRRIKDLVDSRSISKSEFDTADANLKRAIAQVDNLRAVIDKKTIRAPFSGKLGIREVSVGQYLDKGSSVVSLQSLDPIHVEFSLPQQRLGDLREGLTVQVKTDAHPDDLFEGTITAINPDVDPATRNVRVQATLANAAGQLRPGMFVSAELVLARSEHVLLIPETAVLHAPFGDSVFVIEPDRSVAGPNQPLVVRQRFVRLGMRQGDFIAVTSGVEVGEQIVTTGVFKLRTGMIVVIDNSLAPDFQLEPNPQNT
jgi:membrane fusion protein (multidrug efflux system)